MASRNVLRVNDIEEQTAYRQAVAEILLGVQNNHKVTLHEIAEEIGVSLGTISNAANKKTDLLPHLRDLRRQLDAAIHAIEELAA